MQGSEDGKEAQGQGSGGLGQVRRAHPIHGESAMEGEPEKRR